MANQKVLAVDDEEDILELLKFNFSREGYQVHCAESGEQALRLARSESPDLVEHCKSADAVSGRYAFP